MGVVVPCFNEASRLNFEFFRELTSKLECLLIFIDDGSVDGTSEIILKEVPSFTREAEVFTYDKNQGKASAIAKGLEIARLKELQSVIFCDADNSLRVEDIIQLHKRFSSNSHLDVISGARVPLSGSDVIRKDFRKWTGRIVATLVSRMTHIAIYDPMSPLKIYRLDRFKNAPSYIPCTRWLGEVELMFYAYNIDRQSFRIEEVPISFWRDQEGGHIGIRSAWILLKDFYKLRNRILKLGKKPIRIHRSLSKSN